MEYGNYFGTSSATASAASAVSVSAADFPNPFAGFAANVGQATGNEVPPSLQPTGPHTAGGPAQDLYSPYAYGQMANR